MKTCFTLGVLWLILIKVNAQSLQITGLVKTSQTFTVSDILKMGTLQTLPDFQVVTMSGEVRHTLVKPRGVLLRTLLDQAEVPFASPKERGKLYVAAKATDDYTALFSYLDLYNNPTGDHVWVVVEENGKPLAGTGPFLLLVANDKVSGARHVKWLASVVVGKVE
ncbi:molybdopterin-dependent oxidoreductase [Rhabdobacter roseus]|uniref:DMSO/TMAO reductase YedYZ molybdopterin-dependent catalytic subunit n=1 Tax=Rhabdobacter roseus TaxID=1655419 RepID=A0A840TH12_9BACT|nr:molybdopterin-dependent oxidoreductase [Rhabdobacter roseus]MBB5283436.1 DMSO/TMAO reductase YedYZ molybdopterin-dependent catalytic subunit [Rhabdobacter roseus]